MSLRRYLAQFSFAVGGLDALLWPSWRVVAYFICLGLVLTVASLGDAP